MKSVKIITSFVLVILGFAAGAQSKTDVFKPDTKFTWLGLDFSETRLIGETSEIDIQELVLAWNQLAQNEPAKFDMARATGHSVESRLDVTIDHNKSVDLSAIFSVNETDLGHVKYPDVVKIVSSYDYKDLHGIGILFVVSAFSKPEKAAVIWVTFVNMDHREVILAERMIGSPVGFGVRNYWAGAVYSIMKTMRTNAGFEAWKEKYHG